MLLPESRVISSVDAAVAAGITALTAIIAEVTAITTRDSGNNHAWFQKQVFCLLYFSPFLQKCALVILVKYKQFALFVFVLLSYCFLVETSYIWRLITCGFRRRHNVTSLRGFGYNLRRSATHCVLKQQNNLTMTTQATPPSEALLVVVFFPQLGKIKKGTAKIFFFNWEKISSQYGNYTKK